MKQQPKNSHRKPLILYYCIALLIVLILNATVFPLLVNPQVNEVDYSEFLQMLSEQKVKEVEIQSDQIVFSDTAWTIPSSLTGFRHPEPPSEARSSRSSRVCPLS